ncbi:Acyl-CoA dehydrogenase [Planctomycetes bacterium Pan216]|uniref:Acyl-CoA dehydrogenase n=1 Tax=Kolteria novifilia TaxID=2527975 RepID=A0A518B6Z0_9BACT|nr:Acyl-CoA dehydrogenase [Planctomycetes bacterium Pan216]
MSLDMRDADARQDVIDTSAHESPAESKTTFAEEALRLGGKSETEVRKTGAIDRADDEVEGLFAPQYQTVHSPVHRAIWNDEFPIDLFQPSGIQPAPESNIVMESSLEIARRHRRAGTLYDERGKVSEAVLGELGCAGYWGLLVDREYGGQGVPFGMFAPFLTRMATIDPTIAGLASVHGCIGAVDPIRTFGTPEQKAKYLPLLASGERLSAFALTEPGAGSDLTALRTRAVLDGDHYVVNGEKLFITNAICGRTIGLVCLIDDKPAVLIADLPEEENEHFQLVTYGLYALKHTNNNGLRFRDFRVPKENLLKPERGDGLTVAYHGLNLGRVALCATASGNMRLMLANMLPWARFRHTYGEAIERRELVRRRLGRLASMIVGSDALVAWCSWLLDQGYRGEMECIIAKIFGSEAQKDAAIELFMKTHGGRSFIHGHLFGDNVHEFLAPCIYEGEGEMLGMAFFKSLVKDHGKRFFEPIGKALQEAGIKNPNPMNPAHAWALRHAMVPYAKWFAKYQFSPSRSVELPRLPGPLTAHADFAVKRLRKAAGEISGTMRKHQLKLADRQCRMADLSQRIQDTVTILVTALHAGRSDSVTVQLAADVLCSDLRNKLLGRRPSDRELRSATRLGEMVAEGGFASIAGIEPDAILMPYEQDD